MTKSQKNEKLPGFVKIFGGILLAMIALVIIAPLVRERPTVRAASQEPAVDVRSRSMDARSSKQHTQYRDPFWELTATHPDPGVNTDLHQLIASGEIIISHTAQMAAEFILVPRDKLPGIDLPDEVSHAPVLNLSPTFLSRERAFQQLVIYHEYAHYRQWRDGSFPEDTFFLQRLAETAEERSEQCTKKWHAEIDAYHQERMFARASGIGERLDPRLSLSKVIRSTDEQFQRTVLEETVRGDHSAAMCESVWEQLVR